VFVVRQADPSNPLQLPHTEADELASTLPEPSSTHSDTINSDHSFDDDDDYDLQAVLQASLIGGPSPDDNDGPSSSTLQTPFIPPWLSDLEPAPGTSSRPISVPDSPAPPRHRRRHRYGAPGDPPPEEEDLVAASVKRNRIIMDRMLREQEMAQRELLQDELARYNRSRTRRHQQEDEMLRRAIQESKATANIDDADADEDDQEDMDLDQPFIEQNHIRVYDDDDEELQRALKASLETVPQGFTVNFPPQPPPINARTTAPIAVDVKEEDADTQSETEGDDATNSSQQDAEPVSMDELRRKRLARFGG
jgi:ataxin-3